MNKSHKVVDLSSIVDNDLAELKVLFDKAVEHRLAEIKARAAIPGEMEKMPFAPDGIIRRTELVTAINKEAHTRFWANRN